MNKKAIAQPVQPEELKTYSFGEKYPRNPDAKCKCEHWEVCIDCRPTYFNALAIAQPVQPTDHIADVSKKVQA